MPYYQRRCWSVRPLLARGRSGRSAATTRRWRRACCGRSLRAGGVILGPARRRSGSERARGGAARGGGGGAGPGLPAGRPRARPRDVERACRWGVQAVMADGSPLGFEDNVAFVREAAAIARRHGVAVEGELGRLPGGATPTRRGRRGARPIPAGRGVRRRDRRRLPRDRARQRARRAVAGAARARLGAPGGDPAGGRRAARAARRHGAGAGGRRPRGARRDREGQRQHGLAARVSGGHGGRVPGAEPAADLVALHARQADAVEAAAREALVGIALAGNSDLVGRL